MVALANHFHGRSLMSSLQEKAVAAAKPTGDSSLGIGAAVRAFLEGIGFIIGTPSVWVYAAVPAVMMVVLTLLFGSFGFWAANRGSAAMLGEVTSTWGHVADWALTIVLALLGILIAVVLALTLAQPLSCLALEKIVHAQERTADGPNLAGAVISGFDVPDFEGHPGGPVLWRPGVSAFVPGQPGVPTGRGCDGALEAAGRRLAAGSGTFSITHWVFAAMACGRAVGGSAAISGPSPFTACSGRSSFSSRASYCCCCRWAWPARPGW